MKPIYVVEATQDEAGYWTGVVTISPESFAISDGPTPGALRVRMRQAVALLLDADEASFDLDFGANPAFTGGF